MKTTTKRATRRLAASLAIITALATTGGAWAADVKWTGEENNNWGNTNNWRDKASDRPLPTNDVMIVDGQYYHARFTENEIVFADKYVNGWQAKIDGVGTQEAPLVFRATEREYGLQFSNSRNTYIANNSAAYIQLKSGTWSTGSASLEFGPSYPGWITLTDGATFSVGNDIYLNNDASKMTISGGSTLTGGKYFCLRAGEVTVENGILQNTANNFELGQYATITLNLNEGGVLYIRKITYKNNNNTVNNTVLLNGGEIKASVNNADMIDDNSNNTIVVKVGGLGGAINANGLAVKFPRPIAADGANDGGMTFKGGGSVSLKYANTYTGGTTIEADTTLKLNTTAKTSLVANSIAVTIPAGGVADGSTVLEITDGGTFSQAECDAISISDSRYVLRLADNGAKVVIEDTQAGEYVWNDGASGASWKTAGKWSKNDVPGNWYDSTVAVFANDGDEVMVDSAVTAASIEFRGNATVNGSATLTVPSISVADTKTATIVAPTAGALEKTGAGTLTLGSSRSGATTLTEGTLVANASVGTLTLGTDAAKPVTFDYEGQTYSTSFKHDNGCDVTLTNCTFSSFAGVANGTVHVAKDATAWISSWLTTGPGSELTDTAVVLDICGGVVSNVTRNVSLGDHGELGATSEVRVRNDGLFTTGNNIVVGARAAATLTIDDGSVIVPEDVLFCQYADCKVNEDCFVNLNAGGLLTARSITYGSGAATATFTFNGGTLKANQDYTLIANKPYMSVVTATSGTIDAAGFDVTIEKTITGVGGMSYVGGGKVTYSAQPTYTGVTTVEVGTTLVVPAAIAGDKLAFTVPGEIADGVYTVVSISGDSQFADNVLSGRAEGFVLSGDKKKICYVQGMDTAKPIYVGTDGNLSAAGNWLGTVPTGGTGEAQVFCAAASTLTVGDTFAPAKLVIPDGSALVTIGSGTLCVGEVVNRQLLAVGAGATVVIGDQLTLAKGESLCDQNNGTLVVSNLLLKAENGDRYVTTNQTAFSSGVFKFNAVTNSMTDNWLYLADKNSVATNEFYIGAGGLTFQDASGSAGYCLGHNRTGISTTIRPWYSNFTIADKDAGDYSLVLLRNVTFCTDDENGVGRTITIDAKTRARYSPKITVSGSGTLQVNNGNANIDQPTVTVTGTATLAFGENGSLGTGTVTLDYGTTFSFFNTANDLSGKPAIALSGNGEGKATIKVDGTRLKSGTNLELISSGAPEGCADRVTVTGEALGGRKYTLTEDNDGKLLLNVASGGFTLIVY